MSAGSSRYARTALYLASSRAARSSCAAFDRSSRCAVVLATRVCLASRSTPLASPSSTLARCMQLWDSGFRERGFRVGRSGLGRDHLTLTSHACFALACRPDTGCECCFGFRVDIRAAAPRQCTCSGGCGAAAHLSLGPSPRPEPHAMYLKSGQHGSRSTSLLRFRREHSLLLSTRHCAVCRVEGPTRGACSLSNLDPV